MVGVARVQQVTVRANVIKGVKKKKVVVLWVALLVTGDILGILKHKWSTKMEYTEENLTEEMVDNIWAAMLTETCGDKDTTTTYVSISAQKEDPLGLQWSAVGTYHDKDDVELFDFEIESGISAGSRILGIYTRMKGLICQSRQVLYVDSTR